MMSSSEWDAELKCLAMGKPGELFQMVCRCMLTEAFLQPPPSLTNVQAAAAMTYDGVDHILGLASEVVTDGINVLGTL